MEFGEISQYSGDGDDQGEPQRPDSLHWRPPNTACFPCHLNQTHLIQILSSLVVTPRPELGVSDKGEMQNVRCWRASRNVDGNHYVK